MYIAPILRCLPCLYIAMMFYTRNISQRNHKRASNPPLRWCSKRSERVQQAVHFLYFQHSLRVSCKFYSDFIWRLPCLPRIPAPRGTMARIAIRNWIGRSAIKCPLPFLIIVSCILPSRKTCWTACDHVHRRPWLSMGYRKRCQSPAHDLYSTIVAHRFLLSSGY